MSAKVVRKKKKKKNYKTLRGENKSEMLLKEKNIFTTSMQQTEAAPSRWLSQKVVFERSEAPLQELRFPSSLL